MRSTLNRLVKWTLWSVCGLIVLLIALSGMLVLRLAVGPMSVNFLSPYLEEALSASFAGRHIEVRDSVLLWHQEMHRLELQARQVHIVDYDGTTLAMLPIIDVTLNLKALGHGRVALKTLNLEGARVTLARTEAGAFRLGTTQEEPVPPPTPPGQSASEPPTSDTQAQIFADIVKSLVAEGEPGQPLASLEEIRVKRGTVIVHDQRLGKTWRATHTTLSLQRSQDGMMGQAQLNFVMQDTVAELKVTLTYHRAMANLAVDCTFAELQPAALVAVVPNLDPLLGVNVPLSGTISLRLSAQGRVDTVRFNMSGEAGRISLPDIFPEPLLVAAFMARGQVEADGATVTLEEANLAFGSTEAPGPRLWWQGQAVQQQDGLMVQGEAALRALPLKDLARYWPQPLSVATRDQLVQQLSGAVVDELRGTVVLNVPRDNRRMVHVDNLHGTLQAHVPQPHTPAQLTATAAYSPSSTTTSLDIVFRDLRPSALAAQTPALLGLEGVDVALDGKIFARLDGAGALQDWRAEVSGKPGTLTHPRLFPEPRQIASITAQATYSQATRTYSLQEATVSMGTPARPGPRLQTSGTMQSVGSKTTLHAQVMLQALPMAQLQAYWPRDVSPDARAWLTENLLAGSVEEAKTNLAFTLAGGNFATAKLDTLNGTMRYRDLEVHYLRPLPPATGVSGTATFSPQGFRIQIDAGQVAPLQFKTGTVDITGLDQGRDAIAIGVEVRTPLRAALTWLDHPRLNLLADLPIKPQNTDGQAVVRLGFAFPLRGGIDLPKVDITARGTLDNVSLPQVLFGHSVENGQFKLVLNKSGMTLNGTADVATLPLQVTWEEAFDKDAAWRSQIKAVIPRLEANHLRTLGLNVQEYVSGPLTATVSAKLTPQGQGQVDIGTNLQQAALSLPFLGWHKPANVPGEARGTVQLNPAQGHHGTFMLAADNLTTTGTFQLPRDAPEPVRLTLRDLVLGKTRIEDVAVTHDRDTLRVVVGAGDVDAQPFMRSASSQASSPPSPDAGRQEKIATPSAAENGPPIHIHAPKLRRVYFADERYLQHVQARLVRSPAGWELIDIAGQVPESLVQLSRAEKDAPQASQPLPPKTVLVQFRPSAQPSQALVVQTNDLGSVLHALNLHDGMIGGRLHIDGQTPPTHPGGPLSGRLELKEFTLKDAPVLARIFAAASLPGLLKLLNHDGLAFSKLSGDFTLADGIVTTKQVRTHGGSLGLTAKGTVAVKTRTLNLKGTVIPFYGLNTLLSHIPVLGNILVGGKGEGLIAMTYRLTGTFSDAQVSVNPASALTPGFLRGIFDLFESNNDVDIEEQFPSPSSQESTH